MSLLLVLGIVATAILGVLVDWLLKGYLPKKPKLSHGITGLLVIAGLIIVIVLSKSAPNTSEQLDTALTQQAEIKQAIRENTSNDEKMELQVTGTALANQISQLEDSLLDTVILDLPGGHTPPNAIGGAQPLAPDPTLTPSSPKQAIRIQIPSIGVDAPVLIFNSTNEWDTLKKGVGQRAGSVNPGEEGIIELSAHNDIFGEIFKNLDNLVEGDRIILHTTEASYTYRVKQIQFSDDGHYEMTYSIRESVAVLSSSYPYLVDDEHIVIISVLEE